VVSASERQNQKVVTSMTANQPAPHPKALQAVRRAARVLKSLNDEQVLMWEAFLRASRFPSD
jgi:hypothetical protein